MTPTFANVQGLLVGWLRAQLAASSDPVAAGVVVGAAVPATRDAGSGPLIVVRRFGGVADGVAVDRARLDLLHWHQTEYKATQLANLTRQLVLYELAGTVIEGHVVYRPVEMAGPALYPDPAGSTVPIVMYSIEVPVRVAAES